MTALMHASLKNNREIVEFLLNCGAMTDINLNARVSSCGTSALHLACRRGRKEIIEMLIK